MLEKYASSDGVDATKRLNVAIWKINVCITTIKSLASQLKMGARNVQRIANIAFKKNLDMLTGSDARIYQAAINVLYNTLKSANTNAGLTRDKLDALTTELKGISSVMGATSDHLKLTAGGKTKEFESWRDDIRAKVYGGCAASILLGPAVVACYAAAVGILESKIADYKREVEAFVKEFTSWANTFEILKNLADNAAKVSKHWYGKISEFKDLI